MIQANELRIGNYIEDIFNLNNIVKRQIDLEDLAMFINYGGVRLPFKPIELTEEILLKIKGICKQESKILTSKYVISLKRNKCLIITDIVTPNFMIGIAELDFENKMKIDDLVNIWNWDYENAIKLHEFQNMFFSLSGRELEINL